MPILLSCSHVSNGLFLTFIQGLNVQSCKPSMYKNHMPAQSGTKSLPNQKFFSLISSTFTLINFHTNYVLTNTPSPKLQCQRIHTCDSRKDRDVLFCSLNIGES